MTPMNPDPAAADALFDPPFVSLLIHQQRTENRPALQRLWDYYRNDLDFAGDTDNPSAARPYRAAQEQGLPPRLLNPPSFDSLGSSSPRHREVVIENDIAWRIHTLVDFMFARPVAIQSLADDADKAAVVERCLNAAFEANGGVTFFQDAALLGSVYGFVDLLLRADRLPTLPRREAPSCPRTSSDGSAADRPADRAPSSPYSPERALRYASQIVLETVEAPRAIPLLDPSDYRRLIGYMLHYTQPLNQVERASFLARLVGGDGVVRGRQARVDVTEQWSATEHRLYHGDDLVEAAAHPLGVLPVVHIQNLPQPFFYEGLSEVEPLIPLQDELNTRLSDRANRVTFQSFKMYLGKGIESFLERPVAPGQMWTTDNLDAEIQSFGGDGPNPSEDAHIQEIREAMDKASAVTTVAAGLLRNKVGNLTSENALRIVMMGLLARTEKKRVTYGQGIGRLCELILHTLDVAGVLPTTPDQRRVRLHWPSPIPENTTQRLRDAEIKQRLGVPRHTLLAELGYETADQ